MRTHGALVLRGLLVLSASVMAGCAHGPRPFDRVAVAYSTISGPAGESRGTVELWQDPNKVVHVELQLHDLTPGEHGIHFHAVGRCEGAGATAFATAGAHYNPIGRQHGLNNPAGPHAGDAANVTVGADGKAQTSFTTDRITLTSGSTSLFDADGSAIVIHASADDQTSQPSGSSGARIACGTVRNSI